MTLKNIEQNKLLIGFSSIIDEYPFLLDLPKGISWKDFTKLSNQEILCKRVLADKGDMVSVGELMGMYAIYIKL